MMETSTQPSSTYAEKVNKNVQNLFDCKTHIWLLCHWTTVLDITAHIDAAK